MSEVIAIRNSFVPPDQAERSRALDPNRSFLVQAPAGSGKTYLLTQRFLRLLGQAEKPDEIVAITFTKAAAAEMRNRILAELEKAEATTEEAIGLEIDAESLGALARRALDRSTLLGWQILDQPSQLRITTIDAFCRGLALQSPLGWGLLSGLGGRLELVEHPQELYRRAARQTINSLRHADSPERQSVEALLLWRDNNWKDVEDQIVQMLGARNRWYQDFVFAREVDWSALRLRLEAPFLRGVRKQLHHLCGKLDALGGCREFALELARFACEECGKNSPLSLAERAEILSVPFADLEEIEEAIAGHGDLARFLLTKDGDWRSERGLTKNEGFPATPQGRAQKQRFGELVKSLEEESGLLSALAAFLKPIPLRYTEEEWELVRHCFAVLRAAAVELQLVFAETGGVDFTEVAQIALRILAPDENGLPSDIAQQQADGIRHLLVDEFQDTSRNQHQLLARLIAAWPEREGRSCFCVGDPMQSIYGFREAEVELFERLKTHGLEIESIHSINGAEPFHFDFVPLRANFRTAPSLVADLNDHFEQIFAEDDGSGVQFSPAIAARSSESSARIELHLAFTGPNQTGPKQKDAEPPLPGDSEVTGQAQLDAMVALIQTHLQKMAAARAAANGDGKYRIAVLGRTKKSLILVAEALREAGIGFRAIDLVPLRERPEVLDVLALARAVLNPVDRTAWLGVLRAPWCGLSLADLHLLTSADDATVMATSIPELLSHRLPELTGQEQAGPELTKPELMKQALLSQQGQAAAARVGRVLREAMDVRSSGASTALGTWLESIWKSLGGEDVVNLEQRENLRLLWSALDKLPDSEVDLLGPGFDAALEKLCALPDPEASSDYGVQLMTIHKSKGLEFEVVIVPELGARGKMSDQTMLSWLERGLADSDDSGDGLDQLSGELTEFLIAPFQPKGQEAGDAKSWVDGVKRHREIQEMRRVLYVAATRAREELHLFARPRFTVNKKGESALVTPSTSLLATAWPALEATVQARFEEWIAEQIEQQPEIVETLAAVSDAAADDNGITDNLVQMPARSVSRPTKLSRLPVDYARPSSSDRHFGSETSSASSSTAPEETALYARTEGGIYSRVEGKAIHSLLDRLSQLRQRMEPGEAALALAEEVPGITADIRGNGVPMAEARKIAARALATVQTITTDAIGAWILTPHPQAASESHWTGLIGGRQWNLRPDRVFLTPEPNATNPNTEPVWWIIDYKSSLAEGADFADEAVRARFFNQHRNRHAGQLAAYAQVLRSLNGPDIPIRVGIYYPRHLLFDAWDG
ncbi:UvrD-helicase domain-containing protein [Acidicapsa ligni]|uniref:UvrD-helicase domain-containing protein n=1 Tax=Acidicapsa ligni TaxID=542300 RepID=UPI0021E04CF4|nr:UvrD-helicase domain-containing protein [Acidicapsa ligni]